MSNAYCVFLQHAALTLLFKETADKGHTAVKKHLQYVDRTKNQMCALKKRSLLRLWYLA